MTIKAVTIKAMTIKAMTTEQTKPVQGAQT